MTTVSRKEIPLDDRWNVEALYPSLAAWEKDFNTEDKQPRWPELAKRKGKLAEARELDSFLKIFLTIDRHLTKLYTYAHLRHDEDITDDACKQAYLRAIALLHDFQEAISWVEPEILQLPEQIVLAPELADYRVYLDRIFRRKPHTLSAEQEELLALAGKPLETAQSAFGALNNADLKFPSVMDKEGSSHELTHGKYQLYLRSADRVLRASAFRGLHASFADYENTFCTLLQGEVQGHVFNMRSRRYNSSLQAALFPHQIDSKVYLALIETTHQHLDVLHRYLQMRKAKLGYEQLHMYDLYVPLFAEKNLTIDYRAAVDKVIASAAPLGSGYQKTLEEGLKRQRWVDRYENRGKRSGAYSSGCYDSMPYILMNYHGTMNDLKTLAHEVGHSMHTWLSSKHQPYHYSKYPIFVAEVASTFQEELLFQYLLQHAESQEEHLSLINQKIDDLRATLFRQVLFAEFELQIHTWVEQGIPLTPKFLKEEYRKLNAKYYGPEVEIDPEIEIEWARIPHFYYNFYVYQYATGVSAALTLFEQVRTSGPDKYLAFLSGGSSAYPLELLRRAGVDMTTPTPIETAIRYFDQLVGQLSG